MSQVGYAVKYISGPNAGKYWGRNDYWVVSAVPWIFTEEAAKKAQEAPEYCEKIILPVFVALEG